MKQILISIKPQWVERILSGQKTLEIRKTAPKEWTDYLNGKTDKKPEPMVVNIYCTKKDNGLRYWGYHMGGRIFAKFTLNEVEKIEWDGNLENPYFYTKTKEQEELLESACIDDLEPYMRGCEGHAWHISDLVIFDKPKELSEFCTYRKPSYVLQRAPQSWCYVEENK